MFKHENWSDIVGFALDTGAYWIKVSDQLPDGDEYTHRLADAVRDEDKDEVQHLTALLIVKMVARFSSLQRAVAVKTIAEKWCRIFGVKP